MSLAPNPVSKILDAKHDFILRNLKGQFTGTRVTDGGRTVIQEQGDRRYLVSDLEITYKTRITHLEYTGGGRAYMRTAIHNAKMALHKTFTLVLDWVTPPNSPIQKAQQYELRYVARSNKQEALEIWEEEGAPSNIAIFSLRQVSDLVAWCKFGHLKYFHRIR